MSSILTCEQEKYFRKKATADYSCMHMKSSTRSSSNSSSNGTNTAHTKSDWNFFKLDPNFTVWLLQQRNVHFNRRKWRRRRSSSSNGLVSTQPAWAVCNSILTWYVYAHAHTQWKQIKTTGEFGEYTTQ